MGGSHKMSEENKTPVKKLSKTIEFEYPIKWGDKLIESIELRRPKGKHIKKLGGSSSIETLIGVAVKVSEYTPKFFEELDACDTLKVTEAIGDFLEGGEETGRTT